MSENLKKLYQKAQSEKSMIIGRYTEIARHTLPYTEINAQNEKSVSKKQDDIDATILQSHQELNNFIMSTMLGGGEYADVEFDREVFDEIVDEIPAIQRNEYEELTELLQNDSKKIFKLMANSNYNVTVTKSMSECINLGTGCIKLIERDSITEPFLMNFVPVNELFFTEDSFGRPNYVFRKYADIEKEKIEELFGVDVSSMSKKMTLIESCIRNFDGTYTHRLTRESFDTSFHEEKLSYNPFIIFRWNTSHSNSYGLGIGFELIDEFSRLKRYKELERRSAEQFVDKPMVFYGNIEYMHKMNFGIGKMSYGGESPQDASVNPMGLGTEVIPISEQIAKSESIIRESYISRPIGNYVDKSNVTATEIQTRMSLFRERFSGTYELLSDELLKASFITIFRMMAERGLLTFPFEYIDFIHLKYTNQASKSANLEEAQRLVQAKQIVDTMYPETRLLNMEIISTIPYIFNLLDVNKTLFPDEDALGEKLNNLMDATQQPQQPIEGEMTP
ncbi:MAG: hypothetical protein BV458_03520 [Thermoplasmata archaeon M9B2D]|nr:MAG: hypothetical protein BV458_03520 [Thermoplasmata archaeon M9B2D]